MGSAFWADPVLQLIDNRNMTDKLKAIYFTDLLLSEAESFYKSGGHGEFQTVPDAYHADAKALFELCSQKPEKDSRIEHDGITYRCARIPTVGGLVFALRRPLPKVPALEGLGYHASWTQRLITDAPSPAGMQHGLVIFSGITCSGKTTSAGALIAARLNRYGGLAVTLEDPPELPLQGVYGADGRGRCYQCDISVMGGIADAGAAILRFGAPNIIMYGEIREAKAASEAIRAALSGHLIVATLHSSGIPETIERLIGFAMESSGPSASMQLANGLTCIIHQRLETGGEKLQLYADFLFMTEGVRSKIRERQLHTLESDIAQQKNQMLLQPRNKP
jgi:Tfp pilus assembly pilus retraction ATPase PilT